MAGVESAVGGKKKLQSKVISSPGFQRSLLIPAILRVAVGAVGGGSP